MAKITTAGRASSPMVWIEDSLSPGRIWHCFKNQGFTYVGCVRRPDILGYYANDSRGAHIASTWTLKGAKAAVEAHGEGAGHA